MSKTSPPGHIRCHSLTLWKDGQLWNRGFLSDPGGQITLYGGTRYPLNTEFTRATLPAGVQLCPNLTHGNSFTPKWAQDDLREAALRYGYEIFEVDIVPWN